MNGLNPRANSTGVGKAGVTTGPNVKSVVAPVPTAVPQPLAPLGLAPH